MLQFLCAGELRSMLAEFAAGLQSKASKVYSQASLTHTSDPHQYFL